jgi:hypothetical protein
VTLANDTQRFFDREPGYTAQTTDISLADVLTYFQLQPDIMKQFGMFGFYRFNGWLHERAYDRTHCTKAILLNLDKLKDIDYEKGAHTWEDLKFSWDMQGVNCEEGRGKTDIGCDASAAISCKLYRFQASSPQLRQGGCAYMVARADAPVDDDGSGGDNNGSGGGGGGGGSGGGSDGDGGIERFIEQVVRVSHENAIGKKTDASHFVDELVRRICGVLTLDEFEVSDLSELEDYVRRFTPGNGMRNELETALGQAEKPPGGGVLGASKADQFVTALIGAVGGNAF